MSKIIGNTVGTTMLRANWEETDERSSAYIGNKPTADDGNFLVGNGKGNLKEMTPEEVLSHINGASVTTMTTEEYEALSEDEFNANTLYVLTDGEEVSIEDIPNLYVWKKYTAGYSLAKEEVTNQDISYDGSMANQGWDEVKYSDSYEIQDNKIVLINPITVTLSNTNKDVIVGKYIYASYLNSYYEIPSTSAVNYHNSTVYKSIRVDKANKLTVELVPNETKLGYISSKSFSAYPTSGEHTDGYWYEYYRQLGDAAVVDDSSVSFAETDPTVPAWAKAANKPTYTASEVGAVPVSQTITITGVDENGVSHSWTVYGVET